MPQMGQSEARADSRAYRESPEFQAMRDKERFEQAAKDAQQMRYFYDRFARLRGFVDELPDDKQREVKSNFASIFEQDYDALKERMDLIGPVKPDDPEQVGLLMKTLGAVGFALSPLLIPAKLMGGLRDRPRGYSVRLTDMYEKQMMDPARQLSTENMERYNKGQGRQPTQQEQAIMGNAQKYRESEWQREMLMFSDPWDALEAGAVIKSGRGLDRVLAMYPQGMFDAFHKKIPISPEHRKAAMAMGHPDQPFAEIPIEQPSVQPIGGFGKGLGDVGLIKTAANGDEVGADFAKVAYTLGYTQDVPTAGQVLTDKGAPSGIGMAVDTLASLPLPLGLLKGSIKKISGGSDPLIPPGSGGVPYSGKGYDPMMGGFPPIEKPAFVDPMMGSQVVETNIPKANIPEPKAPTIKTSYDPIMQKGIKAREPVGPFKLRAGEDPLIPKTRIDAEIQALSDEQAIYGGLNKVLDDIEMERAGQPPAMPGSKAVAQDIEYPFTEAAPEKSYVSARKVKEPETFIEKVGQVADDVWHKLTRGHYYDLPRTKEYGPVRMLLDKVRVSSQVNTDRAMRIIGAITEGMSKNDFNFFTRYLRLKDLEFDASLGKKLKHGFTEQGLAQDINRWETAMIAGSHPDFPGVNFDAVKRSLSNRDRLFGELRKTYGAAMDSVGMDVSEIFQNPNYLRQRLLEKEEFLDGIKKSSFFKKLRTPEGADYIKSRFGSEVAVNENYFLIESEVMSKMLSDIRMADTLRQVVGEFNQMPALHAEAAAKGINSIRDFQAFLREKGYTMWSPDRVSHFQALSSVHEKLAVDSMDALMEASGLTREQIYAIKNPLLATMEEGKTFDFATLTAAQQSLLKNSGQIAAIPEDLARTLNDFQTKMPKNFITDLNSGWKKWTLLNPGRALKFNINNMLGDLDKALTDPEMMKYVDESISELKEYFGSGRQKMSNDLKEYMTRGGMENSLLAAEEVTGTNFERLKELTELYGTEKAARGLKAAALKYFEWIADKTNYREQILRVAELKRVARSIETTGMPQNFGASLREEVLGIMERGKRIGRPEEAKWDASFKISNERIGPYNDTSYIGQRLRQTVYPFWSWKELNLRWYKRIYQNAVLDGKDAAAILKDVGVPAAWAATRGGIKMATSLLKIQAMFSTVQIWNNLIMGEQEEQLPEYLRSSPHINIPNLGGNKALVFPGQGAMGDALGWLALDEPMHLFGPWLKGNESLGDVFAKSGDALVNTIWQGLGPTVRVPIEFATQRQMGIDAFTSKPMDDIGYAFRVMSMGNLYRAIQDATGSPSDALKGYVNNATGFFFNSVEKDYGAFHDIQKAKREFMDSLGKPSTEVTMDSPKNKALHMYKLALKHKQFDLSKMHLSEYMNNGGSLKGIEQSVKNMEIESGLNSREKSEDLLFLKYLKQHGLADKIPAYNRYLGSVFGSRDPNMK